MTDEVDQGGIRLPGYAERVTTTDGREVVRCTVCGNEAPTLASLEHDCLYSNDLVADGGEEIESATYRVRCAECDVPIRDGEAFVVSGSGVWCSKECWEETHGQPWIGGLD